MHKHEHEACCEHNHHEHHHHDHDCCCEHEHNHHHGCGCCEEHDEKGELLQIISGFAVAAAAFLLEHILAEKYSPVFILVYIAAYLISGWSVIKSSIKNIRHGKIFDEMFLMTVASLGALAIGKFTEGIAVMLLYRIGELLQDKAVENSEKSITALLDIRPEYANLKTENGWEKVSPKEVHPGDTITVKPGESVPLDGKVLSGSSALDTSALTGEPEPRDIAVGDEVLSGCIVLSGAVEIEVTGEYENSAVAKIIEMAEHAAEKKAHTETFISRFAAVYTPVVTFAALAVMLIPPIFVGNFRDWLYRGLIFLVLSCPCALVISVPLTFFGGIGGASKAGVLVRGGNCFDALAKAKTVVFDKTGTLTKGEFEVEEISPEGVSEKELLSYLAAAEALSNHPIARAISEEYEKVFGEPFNTSSLSDYKETSGIGTSVVFEGKTVNAGSARLMNETGIEVPPEADKTVVYAAADGKYIGRVILSDLLRDDAYNIGEKLKAIGIDNVVILSGDRQPACNEIAKKTAVDKAIGELLPDGKVKEIEKLMNENGDVIFMGDGINDAPSLSLASVGAAMGGIGSAAASQAADVILMTDKPSLIVKAIKIARKTLRIARENITFALAVKFVVLVLGVLGIANMWLAVFADVGVCFIAILNSLRMLKVNG